MLHLLILCSNPTRYSLNNPDRVCINTSSMMDGIQVISQPPWYVGNNNKITPADTNHLIAAARYGYRGSRRIQQYNTEPYEVPSKTRTEHTPKFLNNSDNFVNEWVPPIMAAKLGTINGLETPKLWPENTEYTTGFPLKKLPTSWIYKRETTVDVEERPPSPSPLNTLMSKTQESNTLLKQYAKMESTKSYLSLPMTAQSAFENNWKVTLKKNASSSLKNILKREKPPYDAHTLMDPSDTIKYSGTTAMIVHTQTSDELKFRLRMERSKAKSKTPFQLKWQNVIMHYHSISKKLKRGVSMRKAIRSIAKALRAAAMQNGSETSLRRMDFINACQNITYFEEVSAKQLSLLYSLFDPMKRNVMRYVEFIGLLTVLDMPEKLPEDKLQSLWKVHFEFGLDRNIFDIVLEILSCCTISVPDVTAIENLFAEQFRPICYEMAMGGAKYYNNSRPASQSSDMGGLLNNTGNTALTATTNASKGSKATGGRHASSQALVVVESDDSDDEFAVINNASAKSNNGSNGGGRPTTPGAAGAMAKSSGLSVQPQYNICEHFLDEHSLVQVLRQCPKLVALFDSQLSARLVSCHGKDDRYKDPEEDSMGTLENQDFTWIMKKVEHKKEVFGLF
jgi:hypothetical protein